MAGRRQQENATKTMLEIGGEINDNHILSSNARERISACLEQGLRIGAFSAAEFQNLIDERLKQMESINSSSYLKSYSTPSFETLLDAAAALRASSIFASKIIISAAIKSKGFYRYGKEFRSDDDNISDILESILADKELLATLQEKHLEKKRLEEIIGLQKSSSTKSLLRIMSVKILIDRVQQGEPAVKKKRGRPPKVRQEVVAPSLNIETKENAAEQHPPKSEGDSRMRSNYDFDSLLSLFD